MTKAKYLTDYLGLNASKVGAKPALVCDDITLSWSELAHRVDQVAANLGKDLNSDNQQIIGVLFSNSWQFVVAYLAILQTGHIAMPLDPTYKELELDAIIRQVKPLLVITNETYKTKINYKSTLLIDDLLSGTSGLFKRLRTNPKRQSASLTFTSGTTGKPKLVPYTHANHVWNIQVCSEVWHWTAGDNLLISLPLSHFNGLVMGLSGVLYHGNTLYLHEWFDPKTTLETLSSGNISMFTHFPLAYREMLEVEDYKNYDLTKVRTLISGGAPLPPAISEEFKERYGVDILETYGSSETGRIAANSLKDHLSGSPGMALPEVKLKLSQTGEVLIKSPGVFPGYFHNPQETGRNRDPAGWWRTGDLGKLENGRLFLKGRTQEKIRRYGYTLSPRDIEWALHQFSKIKDVYVMGLQKFEQPNDELVYFIDGRVTARQVRDYCKINLPYAWRPDRIVLLDTIPKTRSGKTNLTALNSVLVEHLSAAGSNHY
jgi:acyl-CoA synthetase (AMP-forming)/AMP-acid ligase II